MFDSCLVPGAGIGIDFLARGRNRTPGRASHARDRRSDTPSRPAPRPRAARSRSSHRGGDGRDPGAPPGDREGGRVITHVPVDLRSRGTPSATGVAMATDRPAAGPWAVPAATLGTLAAGAAGVLASRALDPSRYDEPAMPPPRDPLRRTGLAVVALAVALIATACGSTPASAGPSPASPSSTTVAAASPSDRPDRRARRRPPCPAARPSARDRRRPTSRRPPRPTGA